MPVSTLKRMFRKPFCSELLELYRIRVKSLGMNPAGHRFFRKKLKEYIKDIYSKPFINGDDLISLGYYPGPVFRRILHSVENLQLEGDVKSRKEAISFIRKNFPLTGK